MNTKDMKVDKEKLFGRRSGLASRNFLAPAVI